MSGDLYRRPPRPAERRRLDELAAELAATGGAPSRPAPEPAPVVTASLPARVARPKRKAEPAVPPEAQPEESPRGRRHEPQPEDVLRAPLCPRCWHLRDSLGHFWTCLTKNGRPRR